MSHEQPRWRFARMTPAEINQDPVQGEFFSREADLPGRLVREAIQNSLDARREGETVRVRFTFSGDRDALEPEQAAPYLDGLREHVKAVVEGGGMTHQHEEEGEAEAAYDALAHFGARMKYLVVEDFGTTGLTGDIQANTERECGNHFWGFFRSIGISPKGEDAAGSWGLGKWVFPDASIINSYLGMTQRHGEDNWLLMGMSLLKTHHLGDVKYRYYGSFAAHSQEPDERWFPSPIDSDNFVQDAIRDFNLERLEDPGLSVIIPYPKPDLEPAALARAVLTQYFLPIVRGILVVEIIHPGGGERTIDASGIDEEMGRIEKSERDDESPESLRGVVELARWAIEQDETGRIELPAQRPDEALVKRFDLDALRERYELGERLAFRLTLDVRSRAKAEASPVAFQLYLERDMELSEGHDYFVRGHLRIPRMDHIKRQKARALVIVEGDSDLGHMLRDSEGPAHERWDAFAQRLAERWIGPQPRVRAVRNASLLLLQRLVERPAESLTHALAHWFPAGTSIPSGSQSGTKTGGGTVRPTATPQPPPRPLEIVGAKGGFAVRARKDANSLAETDWTVRFAYDSTGRGGPFRQFERGVKDGTPDFSLSDTLLIEASGCGYEAVSENEFTLHVSAKTFRIAVTGFDSRRDVLVDVQAASAVASETQEVAT